tara:strand:- start:8235 stop:10721 length:2487 start_codon:yes stop_codon:yes gene_type:complete
MKSNIQIFKQRKTGDSTTWAACPQKGVSVPSLFANNKKFLDSFKDAERYNLFYTVAHCQGNRELVSQEIIPFDLDDADEKNISLYTDIFTGAVRKYSPDVSKEGVGIVWTGNGLHFLLKIKEPFEERDYFKRYRHAYGQLIQELNEQIEAVGLKGKFDPVVFSHARLMRIPNTINIKKGVEKPCYMIQEKFSSYANPLTIEEERTPKAGDPEVTEYLYDKTAIEQECAFLKDTKENQEQPEPNWFAMVSLLSRLPRGRELVHEYSDQYSEYDFDETETKIDHALKSAPQTCAHICTLFDGCRACPHFGVVKTPLALKGYDIPRITVQTEGTQTEVGQDPGEPRKKLPEFFRHYSPKTNKYGAPRYDDLYDYFKKKVGHVIFHDSGLPGYYLHNNYEHIWERTTEGALEAFPQKYLGPKKAKPCNNSEASQFTQYIKRENTVVDDKYFNPPGLIPFSNGIAQIINENIKFYQYEDIYKDVSPKDAYAFKFKHSFSFDPDCDYPIWRKFLKDVTQDNDVITDCLQEFVGAALFNIPNAKIQKAIILHGLGANGKSVFQEIVRYILHDNNVTSFSLPDTADTVKRVALVGKNAAMVDETPKKGLLEGDAFKQIVGGSSMDYCPKFQQPMEAIMDVKFFISCNHLPFTNDISKGLLRRLLIIPFNAYFPESKQDKDLVTKLKKEASGIMNWAIEGAIRLIRNNYVIQYALSDESKKQVESFKRENNPIYDWLDSHCTVEPTSRELRMHTKEAFECFREELEEPYMRSQSKFTADLRSSLRELHPEHEWPSAQMRIGGKNAKGLYGISLNKDILHLKKNNGTEEVFDGNSNDW